MVHQTGVVMLRLLPAQNVIHQPHCKACACQGVCAEQMQKPISSSSQKHPAWRGEAVGSPDNSLWLILLRIRTEKKIGPRLCNLNYHMVMRILLKMVPENQPSLRTIFYFQRYPVLYLFQPLATWPLCFSQRKGLLKSSFS